MPFMTTRSDKQRLIDGELGEPVEEWCHERRPTSWSELAVMLRQRCGVRVTPETLRAWHAARYAPRPAGGPSGTAQSPDGSAAPKDRRRADPA